MKKLPKGYFLNAFAGVAASTQLALYYGMKGYLTTVTIDVENNYCEVIIHHGPDGLEDAPVGYGYTKRLGALPHYSDFCKKDIYTTSFEFYWQ